MTDQMIGPLTAAEWLSFLLLDGDAIDRNPLPPCCPDAGLARAAVFEVLRAGADPGRCGTQLRYVWPIVEDHIGVPITDPAVPAVLRKLFAAYVADRPIPTRVEYEHALTRAAVQNPDQARAFITAIPAAWNVDSSEGRVYAVARVGAAFVAAVPDPADRGRLVGELADTVGMTGEDVALIVDVADAGAPA